ncbi:hypothetical protein DDB_G0293616 [Dictyostelium discoideum AX4]|uniref:Uncharacterized protein DDB_G0293616 n=1 Tax=Dictyostelium discoideum TaxID=44689 RepID=Y2047_DICDI|nr:hypothetical protein DDB_G0293616 [Dictyostelium discoideum AX4]Q54BH8.1 RecName: Full=Uncharacterized protein DDB_G0293616 [Dictyostelium discoideum]EAL60620.1 hypothetical protein DDB_G0293616 [Dictyostelium discoideum AX4]|eukprot:XP_629051.1 hypothetical protein DDB_G0293616 [Dictyostelium discoideum AX4]
MPPICNSIENENNSFELTTTISFLKKSKLFKKEINVNEIVSINISQILGEYNSFLINNTIEDLESAIAQNIHN